MTERSRAALSDQLVAAGLIVPTTQPGVVGFGPGFESVVDTICDTLDDGAASTDGVAHQRFTFPPVIDDHAYAITGYTSSFPQLAALVSAFDDGDDELRRIAPQLGGLSPADVSTHFAHAGLAMLPAACHPLYAMLQHQTVDSVRRFQVTGRCFRHEPSPDPMRLQSFRMREYVTMGEKADVDGHAIDWTERIVGILDRLGLDATPEIANDPFFGRTGKLLAARQQNAEQKIEFVVDVMGDGQTTAVASVNRPGPHFGELFDITSSSGEPIHTSARPSASNGSLWQCSLGEASRPRGFAVQVGERGEHVRLNLCDVVVSNHPRPAHGNHVGTAGIVGEYIADPTREVDRVRGGHENAPAVGEILRTSTVAGSDHGCSGTHRLENAYRPGFRSDAGRDECIPSTQTLSGIGVAEKSYPPGHIRFCCACFELIEKPLLAGEAAARELEMDAGEMGERLNGHVLALPRSDGGEHPNHRWCCQGLREGLRVDTNAVVLHHRLQAHPQQGLCCRGGHGDRSVDQ